MKDFLTLAAIDIGSNAARMQISRVMAEEKRVKFKKVEYVRYPLQLGKDVFNTGKIGAAREAKFMKLMRVYRDLMELHEVDDYLACATSAMRNAENGELIKAKTLGQLGIDIQVISGKEEAELINDIVFADIDDGLYLHIDVGGGSTELNIYQDQEKVDSMSYRLGSLRSGRLVNPEEVFADMKAWLHEALPSNRGLKAIGTGGNIGKVYKILSSRQKSKNKKRQITLSKIHEVYEELKELDFEERMLAFSLNPDRSDVILPATEIYMKVMELAQCKKIIVPDVGLKDGIISHLYQRNKEQLLLQKL